MTELLAECAMLWLGTTAAAATLVLGILHVRDKRRGPGKTGVCGSYASAPPAPLPWSDDRLQTSSTISLRG